MKRKTKLKPCPFCGGKVRRIIGSTGETFFKCDVCDATVWFDSHYCNVHKREAIEAWNRRADNG